MKHIKIKKIDLLIRYLISIFDIAICFYVKEIHGKFESNKINEGKGKNIGS